MDRQELRDRRKRLGLTQEQLGRLLGVTARAVGKWEAGAAPIIPAINLATMFLLDHPNIIKHGLRIAAPVRDRT